MHWYTWLSPLVVIGVLCSAAEWRKEPLLASFPKNIKELRRFESIADANTYYLGSTKYISLRRKFFGILSDISYNLQGDKVTKVTVSILDKEATKPHEIEKVRSEIDALYVKFEKIVKAAGFNKDKVQTTNTRKEIVFSNAERTIEISSSAPTGFEPDERYGMGLVFYSHKVDLENNSEFKIYKYEGF